MFCKKGALRNSTKFKGKDLWQSLFFNFINPRMHKMGPWGSKHYIFGVHFCWNETAVSVARRCFVKKLLLEIPQNSKGKTCGRVSFLNLLTLICIKWVPAEDHVFGDQFYSKNARKLRFHVFLHFNAREHMILSFYLKWIEFTRNCELVLI